MQAFLRVSFTEMQSALGIISVQSVLLSQNLGFSNKIYLINIK